MQSNNCEHQLAIQKLQSKIQSFKVSSASQVNLPSMGVSHMQDGPCVCSEVFNFVPGTINKQQGAAQYDSQDQSFLFCKQVRFEDGTDSLDLDPNIPSSQLPKVSTPYCSTSNLNCMFNICQISPFVSGT